MKTMKIWRNIFMMLAAFSLASCSSDDDNDKDMPLAAATMITTRTLPRR